MQSSAAADEAKPVLPLPSKAGYPLGPAVNGAVSGGNPASPSHTVNSKCGDGSKSPLRTFRSMAWAITGIVRAQTIVDEEVPSNLDVAALVQRIAVTLSSSHTFQKVAIRVFEKFCVPGDSASGGQAVTMVLPVACLPDVLAHWQIPEEHVPIFWAMIRKHANHWDSLVLPDNLCFADFQGVLAKVLRRVRDKFCGVDNARNKRIFARDRFVTQNTHRLEQDYIIDGTCGKGSFGECFFVTHRQSKLKRVAKKIPKEDANVPSEEVQGELNALKSLDHPNILRVFEWFESEDSFYLLVEAALGGDLKHMLVHAKEEQGAAGLSEDFVQDVAAQSLRALAYIHSKHIIHRDIKPANILLATADAGNRPRILLADFGVAEIFEEHGRKNTLLKGTILYMAPEIFMNEVWPRSDVWALGVVVYELLSGERPYTGDNPMALYAKIKTKPVNYDPVRAAGASSEAVNFLMQLLTKEVQDRPCAAEALQNDWLVSAERTASKVEGRKARKMRKSFAHYMHFCHFSKTAMNCIAAQLDTSKIEGLSEVFQSLDIDNDGTLALAEFAIGLAEIGIDPDEISQLIDAVDIDHDGRVSYSEFVASLMTTQGKLVDDVICHAFKLFDTDGDTKISLEELRIMLSGEGPLVAVLPDGKTVEQVLAEVDTSKDGTISLQEFRAYLTAVAAGQEPPPQQVQCPSLEDVLQTPSHARTASSALGSDSPKFCCNFGDNEPLKSALLRLSDVVGRSQADLLAQAKRLEEEHWMSTVGDLREVGQADWARLGIPFKLERALRAALCSSCETSVSTTSISRINEPPRSSNLYKPSLATVTTTARASEPSRGGTFSQPSLWRLRR